ncbi:MAG: hypothetical protein R3D85_09385 [Paracoccaceae bacterium]
MRFCRELGVLYIDTVVEPWAGYYFGTTDKCRAHQLCPAPEVVHENPPTPGGTTARSAAAAPIPAWSAGSERGSAAAGHRYRPPDRGAHHPPRLGRADAGPGRQGHPYRRARHQARRQPRPRGMFVNTVGRGFIAEGFQPAELAGATHEPWFPRERPPVTTPAAAPASGSNAPAPSPGPYRC